MLSGGTGGNKEIRRLIHVKSRHLIQRSPNIMIVIKCCSLELVFLTGDLWETSILFQGFSATVQRFNVALLTRLSRNSTTNWIDLNDFVFHVKNNFHTFREFRIYKSS